MLNVKDAICSAMDVMQAMASSICLFLPKVHILHAAFIDAGSQVLFEIVMPRKCYFIFK